MAGIGFELRKLFREEGIVQNIKAYGYSSFTTIGPMILTIVLVFIQQNMITKNGGKPFDNELFISTMTYCFVFSILITSGLTMILTRYIADSIYERKLKQIIASFYGALIIILPVGGLIGAVFLYGVSASVGYKLAAYLFFVELIIIWIQAVYLSALKDFKRIVRSFAIAIITSMAISYLLFTFTEINLTTGALIGMDVGFGMFVALTMYHFEQVFPTGAGSSYFHFLRYFKKFPVVFFSGVFLYGSVYVHNIIYWIFSDSHTLLADQFLLMPFYDLPVFYAYLSVIPSLVMFVVIVETDFYEKFLTYYKNVVDGGTYKNIHQSKKEMQNVLFSRIGFVVEIQLVFTALAIALGLIYLPRIGVTTEQIDLFIFLCLGYFFYINAFIVIHALMYFDDRKGVLSISAILFFTNTILTFISMNLGIDGLGIFIAAFVTLVIAVARLLYVLSNLYYYTFCSQPLSSDNEKVKPLKV